MRLVFSKFLLWAWRATLIAGCVLFFLWLVWQNVIPSGYLRIENDFSQQINSSLFFSPQQKFISDLYPADRVSPIETDASGRCWQQFFSEPVYFKINLPRSFEKVRIKIFYQNIGQPLLQIGLMKINQGSNNWAFQLQPLENQIFDQLNWYKIVKGGVTLWQKNKKFNTVEQFVNHLPVSERLATFDYNLTPEAITNPKKIILWNSKTPLQYVDYIISNYQSPKIEGDLKKAEAKFFINSEFSDGRQIEFMLSAPDLVKNQQTIKIYKIEAELEREPLTTENLLATFNNLLIRLINKI